MKYEFEHAANGIVLKVFDVDGTIEETLVYQERDDDEVEAFAEFLWDLSERCGPSTSRYSPRRIVIRIEPGDEYEPPRRRRSGDEGGGYTVRPVSEDDREAWVRMRGRLWPYGRGDHAEEIARHLAGPPAGQAVFVAGLADGTAIGFLEASIANRADGCDGPRIGYVEGWYVEEGHRGRGVGRELIRAAERWARDAGCRQMASDCDLENLDACWAHQRTGFYEVGRGIHFRKDLEAPEAEDAGER